MGSYKQILKSKIDNSFFNSKFNLLFHAIVVIILYQNTITCKFNFQTKFKDSYFSAYNKGGNLPSSQ